MRLVCGVVYCIDACDEEADKAMAPMLDVAEPLMHGVGRMPLKDLNSAFDGLYGPGDQWYWRGAFLSEIPDEAIERNRDWNDRMPASKCGSHVYPIDGAAHDVAPEDTAFAYRDATWSQVFIGVDADPASRPRCATGRSATGRRCTRTRTAAAYVNFMMEEGQARVKATYGAELRAARQGQGGSTTRTTSSASTRTSCRPRSARHCRRRRAGGSPPPPHPRRVGRASVRKAAAHGCEGTRLDPRRSSMFRTALVCIAVALAALATVAGATAANPVGPGAIVAPTPPPPPPLPPPPPAPTPVYVADLLTRIYRGDDGGALYLRQLGSKVYGFGEHPGRDYAYVLVGSISGDRITGSWWDVPKGKRAEKGSLELRWSQLGARIVRSGGGDLGPDVFAAIPPDGIPWPVMQAAGFQETTTSDLTGAFGGDDGSRHYVRESSSDLVWVAERAAQPGERPGWVTAFAGTRFPGGGIGTYVDVPKGLERNSGQFGATLIGGTRELPAGAERRRPDRAAHARVRARLGSLRRRDRRLARRLRRRVRLRADEERWVHPHGRLGLAAARDRRREAPLHHPHPGPDGQRGEARQRNGDREGPARTRPDGRREGEAVPALVHRDRHEHGFADVPRHPRPHQWVDGSERHFDRRQLQQPGSLRAACWRSSPRVAPRRSRPPTTTRRTTCSGCSSRSSPTRAPRCCSPCGGARTGPAISIGRSRSGSSATCSTRCSNPPARPRASTPGRTSRSTTSAGKPVADGQVHDPAGQR